MATKVRWIKTKGGNRIIKIKSDKKVEELLKIGCSEVDEKGDTVKKTKSEPTPPKEDKKEQK